MEGGRGYSMEGGRGYSMEGGRGYSMEGGRGYNVHGRHFGSNSFQDMYEFYGDHFEEVWTLQVADTPSLSVCSYLVCFVEGLLQQSADWVRSEMKEKRMKLCITYCRYVGLGEGRLLKEVMREATV